jgi:monofunctional biosynthetic peptidoglycan transglycosylase
MLSVSATALPKYASWMASNKLKTTAIIIGCILIIEYLALPNNSIRYYEKHNPIRTALMQQRMHEAEARKISYSIKNNWVPMSRISRHLINAVIVAEDGSFYDHEGVDWFEVEESIRKNIEKGRAARGGSTISQQLAKNLYLSTSKNPLRKFKELIITLRMERYLSKRRILEIYLNCIEWGDGIFGAEAASRKYFGKPASQLSRDEAVRLAAVIPSPLKHRPDVPTRYVTRRSSLILSRMEARGY